MAEKEVRNFALRDNDGNDIRGLCWKVASLSSREGSRQGYTYMLLREQGYKKVHLFDGKRVQADKPMSAPA
jgi:hypothetical protein